MDWSGKNQLAHKNRKKQKQLINQLWNEYKRLKDTYEPNTKDLKKPDIVKYGFNLFDK